MMIISHRMLQRILFIIGILQCTFSTKLYLSVEENQKPNSPVGNIVKLIQNQTKPVQQTKFNEFKLEMDKSISFGQRNLISVDEKNGDIWIQSAIDREEICQQISKCEKGTFLEYLIIADGIVFELQIEVIDLNDNDPTFQPDEKTLKIPEGITKFTEFSLPVAKDKDSAKFGIKTYSLKPISTSIYEKYFELIIHPQNHNPYLRVIEDLDRESIKNYEFHLFAVDGGGNRGKCKITVEITDINDNTPQWIGLPYRKEISECTTEHKIMQLVAQDKDDQQTEGGQIRFKISENSPNVEVILRMFFITENTLYLNNGALKTFDQNKISIVVIAADGGGRSNETTIELEIKDCNDHSPVIHILNSNLQIPENEKSKIVVTMITVTDQDQGINSEFTCNLNDTNFLSLESIYQPNREVDSQGQKKIFKLNTVPGMGFDREKMSRHIVEILCTDNGSPTMSSSEKITIFIKDENDNRPTFEGQYKTFSISEDAKIGSEVGKIVATDIDSIPNNVITYSIVGQNDVPQTFSINNFGQIQLSKSVDRETKDQYEFSIVATDSGKPTLNDSCSIRVIVVDVNDNAPEIPEKHYFKIVESWGQEQKHWAIGKLNATDRDHGVNGTFYFRLRSMNPKLPTIQVFNDGRMSIFGVIDREKSDSIEAQIDVIDYGSPALISTTTLFIEILDLNDNKPRFTFPTSHHNNHVNVSMDYQLGTVIATVSAVDPDKDVNGTVSFFLIGTDMSKKYFTIHNDGKIILNDKLSDKIRPDRLKIEARDHGNPAMTFTTNLYLRYPMKKPEPFDPNGENGVDSKHSRNVLPRKKPNSSALSNSMVLLGFLAVSIVLILIGIAGIGIYLYCRSQGVHRLSRFLILLFVFGSKGGEIWEIHFWGTINLTWKKTRVIMEV